MDKTGYTSSPLRNEYIPSPELGTPPPQLDMQLYTPTSIVKTQVADMNEAPPNKVPAKKAAKKKSKKHNQPHSCKDIGKSAAKSMQPDDLSKALAQFEKPFREIMENIRMLQIYTERTISGKAKKLEEQAAVRRSKMEVIYRTALQLEEDLKAVVGTIKP